LVEEHTVSIPNGPVIDDWTYVVTPNFINILPVTDDGEFLVFRQVKYAVGLEFGCSTLATVGGLLEQGEDPQVAALRELKEEMGFKVRELVSLGSYAVDGNRGAGVAHLYLGDLDFSFLVTTLIHLELSRVKVWEQNRRIKQIPMTSRP